MTLLSVLSLTALIIGSITVVTCIIVMFLTIWSCRLPSCGVSFGLEPKDLTLTDLPRVKDETDYNYGK